MKKEIPTYGGTLRDHALSVPSSIYTCSGICIFGRRIKSLVFSTDVAIIKNTPPTNGALFAESVVKYRLRHMK